MLLISAEEDMNEHIGEQYKDRIRIFLIICFLSEEWKDENHKNRIRRLHSETYLQKMDFLIRNPDYFCLLLIDQVTFFPDERKTIQEQIKKMFADDEPEIKRDEMERFFYGAYEHIDDSIAFLIGLGLIEYSAMRNQAGSPIVKDYYVTQRAIELVARDFSAFPSLIWYVERIKLLRHYFGGYTGTQLRRLEYTIDEYSNAKLTSVIPSVADKVRIAYEKEFGEQL